MPRDLSVFCAGDHGDGEGRILCSRRGTECHRESRDMWGHQPVSETCEVPRGARVLKRLMAPGPALAASRRALQWPWCPAGGGGRSGVPPTCHGTPSPRPLPLAAGGALGIVVE